MILSANNCLYNLVKASLLTLALLFALVSCFNGGEEGEDAVSIPAVAETAAPAKTAAPKAVRVVVTTNIMADWVKNVGGESVEVFSIVPLGADPHTFQPGAQDVARIADADLVLSVGLGLEESWLDELLENAARDESVIVEVGGIVDPIEFAQAHADEVEMLEELGHIVHEVEEGEITPEAGLGEIEKLLEAAKGEEEGEEHGEEEELAEMVLEIVEKVEAGQIAAGDAIEEIEHITSEGEEEHDDHGHGIHDPHFWFDPVRVKTVVNDMAARLAVLDPDRGDTYRANAASYNVKLDELHAWTKEQVDAVPEERRLLVTSHDSLGYFADLYGFEVVGVVFGVSTETEPSAEDLADLVHEVEEYGAPAVFGETTVSERLAGAVATESGVELVRLYSGSLGLEGSGAETYLNMVRTNVQRIVEALK